MPRKPSVDKPTLLNVSLPESTRAKLDLFLFSEVEGRVPHGAYSAYFGERIQEHLSWRRMDLEEFGFPPGSFITGPKETLELLARCGLGKVSS